MTEENTQGLEIDLAKLRKQKLYIASPIYGGMCHSSYTDSMVRLSQFFTAYDLQFQYFMLSGESLVQRARNYCVEEFLNSDATHMIFIDSDIGFSPEDVLTLWHYADTKEYNVVCGPYPKKMIAWEKIKTAVDKGLADKNPTNLENFVGDYVFNPANGPNIQIDLSQPFEVGESGTGFMCIHRNTFDVFRKNKPEIMYTPDHARMAGFDGKKKIGLYFDCVIDKQTNRYLSEDYYFCREIRKMGMKVWLVPWIKLTHTGSYVFGGSMVDLLRIGESLTVDTDKIKK